MKCFPALCNVLIFIFLIDVASAGQIIYLEPTDENGINNALSKAGDSSGFLTVYLNAGVYEIKGPINVYSNTLLTGSPDAIIKVSSDSNQWFVGGTGIINHKSYPLKNVEICGFQIDGNLENFPESYAHYKGEHDAERLIYLRGSKTSFMENISIHDMKLYNSFSDGIQIAYANTVTVSDNFVSNCQHSGIFFISVTEGVVQGNDVAGITSDCVRLDNCVRTVVTENVLYSYTGDDRNGQAPNGENGLQIADEGFSKGGGGNKPLHTTDIEVYNNVFANTGWHGVWLDSTGKGYDNVYIHDNTFLNGKEFTNPGKPVTGISRINPFADGEISYSNPPSTEMSKDVFNSIDSILKIDYTLSYPLVALDLGASSTVIFNNMSYDPHSLIEVSGEDLQLVKYEYRGDVVRHFIDRDLWIGDLQHIGQDLYIPGQFEADALKITVYSEEGYQAVSDIQVVERKLSGAASINPDMFIFISILAVLGFSISRNLRRIYP